MYEYELNLVSEEGDQKWEYVIYEKITVFKKKYDSQTECMNDGEKVCELLEKINKTQKEIKKLINKNDK